MGYLGGLASIKIHREPQGFEERRREDRHTGLADSATLLFRGEAHQVTVVNISSRGTMVECTLYPRIGETMMVEFDQCSRIQAFVRWVRDGRIGLNFGHEIILG
jgi:hypothetical protein